MAGSDIVGDVLIKASYGEAGRNCSGVDLCYAFASGADM